MSIFAFITNDIVQNIVMVEATETQTAQQVADAIAASTGYDRAEDTSGLETMPDIGWIWELGLDPHKNGFPVNPAARVIPKSELAVRFTEAEWEVIANSTASKAIAFKSFILTCGSIWLDEPRLISYLDAMVTAGVLTSERPAEIRDL
jgi:hypothetical protein